MLRILSLAPALFAMTLVGVPSAGAAGGSELAGPNNRFGIELFRTLHENERNTFISPASVAICLQAVAEASRGETRRELVETLHLGGLAVGEAVRATLDELHSRDDVVLKIANSLWTDPAKIMLNEEYVEEMERQFDADVRSASFADPAALAAINGWIDGKTEGMIPEMLDRIPPEAVAYLINAIYFKGVWAIEFDPDETTDGEFRQAAGGVRPMPLMKRTGRIRHLEDGGAQVAMLPYGEGGETAMWIILPDSIGGLESLVDSLDVAAFDRWRQGAAARKGTLVLPRFRMRYKAELNDPLIAMGIESAFDPGRADLSRLGDPRGGERLVINRALHEAVVEVNEQGTEAAAATAVEIAVTSVAPSDDFTMICDRPFLFAISDEPTGSILFLGAVHEPEALE